VNRGKCNRGPEGQPPARFYDCLRSWPAGYVLRDAKREYRAAQAEGLRCKGTTPQEYRQKAEYIEQLR